MRKISVRPRAAKTAKAASQPGCQGTSQGGEGSRSRRRWLSPRPRKSTGLLQTLRPFSTTPANALRSHTCAAAELAFRLQDEYGLTQFKIGARIGRLQQWVSAALIWRSNGYPDTAFGPQAKQARAKLLPVTGKTEPDRRSAYLRREADAVTGQHDYGCR